MRGHASQADRASLERGGSSEPPTAACSFVEVKPGDLKNPRFFRGRCRWYAHICDRGVIERKSHERAPRGKDRYGTITNPNPASRGARGLAPIPVHRLKAPLRQGIFPKNHSDWA